MLDKKAFKRNLSAAFAALVLSYAASAVTYFLMPKIMSVTDFAYWQLFIFYTTYANLSQLGVHDGVYLIEGGKTLETIDREKVGRLFSAEVLFQGFVAIALAICSLLFVHEAERLFALLGLSLYVLVYNLSRYLGNLYSALNRTDWFSRSHIIERGLFTIGVIILAIAGVADFRLYVMLLVCTFSASTLYLLYKGSLFRGFSPLPLKKRFWDAFSYARVGVVIIVSNSANVLLLGMSRFFIDGQWGIGAFGEVSFALTLTSFALSLMQQFSLVLFPALRTVDAENLKSYYHRIEYLCGISLPLVYLVYFPLAFLVDLWLPSYATSVAYLVIMMPICFFDGKTSLLGNTYLNVMRKEKTMLAVNIVSVSLSTILFAIETYVFADLMLVLYTMPVVVGLRNVLIEACSRKALGYTLFGIDGALGIAIAIVFVAIFSHADGLVAFALMIVVYVIYLAFLSRGFKRKLRTAMV